MNMSESEIIRELERQVERLSSAPATFLAPHEVAMLTGRRAHKLQIEVLRKQGLPFFLNAAGKPIVPRSSIDGKPAEAPIKIKKTWQPPD